jgi:hypothetical protein
MAERVTMQDDSQATNRNDGKLILNPNVPLPRGVEDFLLWRVGEIEKEEAWEKEVVA